MWGWGIEQRKDFLLCLLGVHAFSMNVTERMSRMRSEPGVIHSLPLPLSMECGLVQTRRESQLSV